MPSSVSVSWPNSLPVALDDTWAWTHWAHEDTVSPEVAGQALQWWLKAVAHPEFDPTALLPTGKTRWQALLSRTSSSREMPEWEISRPCTRFPLPGEAAADPAGGRFIEWAAAAMVLRGQDPWLNFPDEGLVELSGQSAPHLALSPVVDRGLVSLLELCVRHPSATAERLNRVRWHGHSLVSRFLEHPQVLRALADKGMDFNAHEAHTTYGAPEWVTPIAQCTTADQLTQLLRCGADPTHVDSVGTSLSVYVNRSSVLTAHRKAMMAILDQMENVTAQDKVEEWRLLAVQGRPLPAGVNGLPSDVQDSLLTSALVGWLDQHNKTSALVHLLQKRPVDRPWPRETWMELAWAVGISRSVERPDPVPKVAVCTPASHEVMAKLCTAPSVIKQLEPLEGQSAEQQEEDWSEALLRLVKRLQAYPSAQEKVLAGSMALGARKWSLPTFWATACPTLNSYPMVWSMSRRVNRDHALRHPTWSLHRLLAQDVFDEAQQASASSPPLSGAGRSLSPEVSRLLLNFYNHGAAELPHFNDGKVLIQSRRAQLSDRVIQVWLGTLPCALSTFPPPCDTWAEWLNTDLGQRAEQLWVKNQPASQPIWDQLRAEHRAAQTIPLSAPVRRPRARP